ncbi:baseplate J/gp47 family protein, partial [Staphylococcus aureus]
AIGAVSAPAGTITTINTPTRGWQSVTNPADAVPGAEVESDAALRSRQKISTAIPSLTVFEGIVGAVAGVSGVTRYRGYENDTNST